MFHVTRWRTKPLLLGLLTLSLLAVPKAVFGFCDIPQPRLLRAEYSQSDAVVVAHLVKSQHINPKNVQDYHLYTFEVDQIFRGEHSEPVCDLG